MAEGDRNQTAYSGAEAKEHATGSSTPTLLDAGNESLDLDCN